MSRKLRAAAAAGNFAVLAAVAAAGMPATSFAGSAVAATLAPSFGGSSLIGLLVATSAISSLLLLAGGKREGNGKAVHAALPVAKEPAVAAVGSGAVAGMCHDLRTPLNAIIGFSDIMQQELHGPLGSDRYHSYAQHIRDSGEELLRAIETTLAFAEEFSEQAPAGVPVTAPGASRDLQRDRPRDRRVTAE